MRKEKTLTVNVPPKEFLDLIQKKIDLSNSKEQSKLFSSPPFLDYSGIKINGNKLIIEKTNKLLDGTSSPYFSFFGFIYIEIIENGNRTKLVASFDPSTAMQDFASLAFAIGISMSAITFLILNPNWIYALIFFLVAG